MEDFKLKNKFRRTAKSMWEQLKENYDFKGSKRIVRNYVSKRKKELSEELNKVTDAALPLENRVGLAQVDFGQAPFNYQDKEIKFFLFPIVMPFPF